MADPPTAADRPLTLPPPHDEEQTTLTVLPTVSSSPVRTSAPTRTASRALRFLPLTALTLDVVLMCLAVVAAVIGRRHLSVFDTAADVRAGVVMVAPVILLTWLVANYLSGCYRPDVFGAGPDEFKRVVNGALVAAGLVGVISFLAKASLSRGFFLLLFGIGGPAIFVGRLVLRRAVQQARIRGVLQQRVLIAGGPGHVDEIAAVLHRESWLGYHVVGALTPARHVEAVTKSGIPVVGNTEDIAATVAESEVDVVFFAGGSHTSGNQMRKIVWELEAHSVQLVVAPSVTDISSERIRVRPVGGLPLMHLDPPTWSDASRVGKRAFDLVGSVVLLVLLTPVLAFISARVAAHDRGPVLFRQTRTGRHGEEFSCLKFRSMVVDAEARLAELHAETGYVDGLFKDKEDPRVTGPGKWLRRFSLDELPQLWNVVRGDMSLVGPRPPLPLEVERYQGDTARRLHVRPGMTGLWQVSGRSDLSWEEAVRLDLFYVDNWSMLQDLNILFKTAGAVVSRRGAY